jgi:type II secretory pathway component PulC
MRSFRLVVGALAVGICHCGSAGPSPARPVEAPAASPPPPAAGPASDHRLRRSVIHAAIAQGLGSFLQHIELDDVPVRVAGKFRGFRIAALRGEAFWAGVELQPGDVVTRVNGFPIERPEQAQAAFESLDVASELRISYERDGESRELVYPIVDDH